MLLLLVMQPLICFNTIMNIDAGAKKGEQINVHYHCVKESIKYYIMHTHKYSFQRVFFHSAASPR